MMFIVLRMHNANGILDSFAISQCLITLSESWLLCYPVLIAADSCTESTGISLRAVFERGDCKAGIP